MVPVMPWTKSLARSTAVSAKRRTGDLIAPIQRLPSREAVGCEGVFMIGSGIFDPAAGSGPTTRPATW